MEEFSSNTPSMGEVPYMNYTIGVIGGNFVGGEGGLEEELMLGIKGEPCKAGQEEDETVGPNVGMSDEGKDIRGEIRRFGWKGHIRFIERR
jgi:hypothetical protein